MSDIDTQRPPGRVAAGRYQDDLRTGIAHALCVHGAGGGAWEWALWRGVFNAHGVECGAIDLQPADGGPASTGVDDYVAQVRIALTAMPRPRALVGASLGGLLALACADDADALVLVNPLPPTPWASRLPPHTWPDVVRWSTDARLASTRRALFDSDEATVIEAMRRWRDESGRVLRDAHAGLDVEPPRCPVLCIASGRDEDVPPALTAECAFAWSADLMRLPEASHVGPLLGREATSTAARVVGWLQARRDRSGELRVPPR
ncbi:alpha/beta fold hydrolase [Cognatilysobacter bugurensis]|nr:alpha/beta hydrolase [Lysobacter bugurensis]